MPTLLKKLPVRKSDSNKGDFGHVLIIGGDYGMGGAVIMAAEAACHAGAGRVTVLSRKENYAPLLSRTPNVMTVSQENPQKILKGKTVIVIGPGLGKSAWAKELLTLALDSDLPKIVDADALNLISENKEIFDLKNCVLTPHPGEAARLLGLTVEEIQNNRESSVKKLFEKFRSVCVLKGKGSLVFSGKKLYECKFGNPGMAVAGMGDVLSGIIAAFVAQKMSLEDAAIFGVEIHAKAADIIAKKQGIIGIVPSDVIAAIPAAIKASDNS